ncbi:ImmA/IrrE family metallo-endopeptidase [Corynebacterium sp. AOP34-AQ2-28]|uniref:ImmA/IrrE family metallo-endopeptidase n=1 Tax=Corynebacterium TaxID=1716 RepID=UPI0026EE6894|nr:ImmA/IrrE family metallo-endopeptidase [Corynebacterium glyciniphilum]
MELSAHSTGNPERTQRTAAQTKTPDERKKVQTPSLNHLHHLVRWRTGRPVRWHIGGPKGAWKDGRVSIRHGMSDAQTKSTIAHELSHVAHDDLCDGDDAVEDRANREASHLLIPPMAYAKAELAYGPDIHKIAEEIGVTTHLAMTWRDTFKRRDLP